MKKRCIYCHKVIEDNLETCPYCQKKVDLNNLSEQETHELHQYCHNQITKGGDYIDNGLTFTVIGVILAVIGAVLLYVSNRYNNYGKRIWIFTSVEFIVGVVLLSITFGCLVYGVFRIVSGLLKKSQYKKIIEQTAFKK